MPTLHHAVRWSALALVLAGGSIAAAQGYSEAEQALFMSNQLARVQPPATLRYSYHKSGSLEPGFDDSVEIRLRRQADGTCCAASAQFLSGERQLKLPDIEAAQGNPVILYFLERDVREMQRLTKGQQAYFRKRLRMAVYQGAAVKPVMLAWQGREVAGREITVAPYRDDPMRARFERFALKQYVFTLSDAVPGGVYAMRSRVAAANGAAEPLLEEELIVEGAPRAN
jgi:hypothetical protein